MVIHHVVALIDNEEDLIAGLHRPLGAEIQAQLLGKIIVLGQQAELQVRTEGVDGLGGGRADVKLTLGQADLAQLPFAAEFDLAGRAPADFGGVVGPLAGIEIAVAEVDLGVDRTRRGRSRTDSSATPRVLAGGNDDSRSDREGIVQHFGG